jgi:trimeric autotransporter adhesin
MVVRHPFLIPNLPFMSNSLRSARTRALTTATRPWLAAALGLLPLFGAEAQQRPAPALPVVNTQEPLIGAPVAPRPVPAVTRAGGQQHRTTAAIASTATGGNWSAPTTWVGGVVPTATDDVTIVGGATVTLDVAATCGSLTVATTGSLLTSATTAYSLTVAGSVTNNGTLDLSASTTIGSDLRFTGAGDATFGGTGTTDLQTMSLAKSVRADIVDMNLPTLSVKGTAAATDGFLFTRTTGTTPADDMTGTLKISGTATLSNRVFGNAPAYIIPATGGFWLSNPNYTVVAQTGSPTINGLLRLSAGTFNVGTGSGNSATFGASSVYTQEGGTLSAAGRFTCFTSASTAVAMTFTMSGGTINVSTAGNASGTPSFGVNGTTTISGGNINLVQRSTATTPLDYYVAGTYNFTGGTLNVGTTATATNFDFRVRGNLPNVVIDNTGSPKSMLLAGQTNPFGTVLINPTTTLNLNGALLLQVGPTITNNGTLTGTLTGSRLYFQGTTAQSISGTGTVTSPLLQITFQNASTGVTVGLPITTRNVAMFRGNVIGANNLTVQSTSSALAVISHGVTSPTSSAGNFDVAPTFDVSTSGLYLIYNPELAPRTTGFEIPASRTAYYADFNNPQGVTLAGGNLTVVGPSTTTSSIGLLAGIVTTSAANKLISGVATTVMPAGSATAYVRGPLGVTVNSATAVSRLFAVGDAAFRPVLLGGIVNSADQTYTATVVSGPTGGSGLLLNLNPTRYVRLENTANLPATATVQLSYGADDTGIDATALVAQAATAAGTYTSRGGAPVTTPVTGIVSTQNLTPGNDYFVLATPAACNATFSYPSATYCTTGTNPTPTAPGTIGGTFSSTTGLSLNATTGVINLAASTPGTYVVAYDAGPTCSGATTVTITAPATAGFSYAATSYCNSATTAVTPTLATGATAGTFSSTTGLSIDSFTGGIVPSTSTPGTYTVTNTVAAAGGCAAVTSTTTVTITAPATAGFSYANASYCTSATAAAAPTLATGATAGTFSSTTGLTIDAATGAITPSTSTPGTYTVTNTLAAAGGCAAVTSTATVTITAAPLAAFSYTGGSYCSSSTTAVAPTLGTGATAGTFSSTAGLTIDATTGAITPSTSTPGIYTVTNTVAAAGGCAAVTSTATVSITTLATAGFSYANASYCTSATTAVAPTLATGATAGTFSSTTGLTINATTGAITPSTSTPGTYTITNSVAASGGCAAATSTATVTITAPATAGFSYASTSYCTSATATAAATLATGATAGTFSSTTGLTISATTGAITPSTSTPGTYTVTNTVAAAGGCAAVTSTATVTITEPQLATFSYPATGSNCAGSTATIAATLGAGSTAGTFSSTTGLTINATTGAINVATSTAGTYTVTNTVAAAGGCAAVTSTATVTINAVPAQPTVTIRYTTPGTAVLTASAAPTGATYQWYLGTTAITGATSQTYTANGTAQPGAYTVVVTSAQGCASPASAALTVTATSKPLAGSALSVFPNPTPDGKLTLELTGYAKPAQLTVVNALGQVVQTQTIGAGQNRVAVDLTAQPVGVYLLRVTTDGGTDVRRVVRQ